MLGFLAPLLRPPALRPAAAGLLALLAAFLLLSSLRENQAIGAPANDNLLAALRPMESSDVASPDRLTDGVAAVEGDLWQSNLTSTLRSSKASVQWDLGTPTNLCCLWLQGDANDRYQVSGSTDGTTWNVLWEAEPARGPGLRARHTDKLDGAVRYVRLTATGGDGRFAVSEVQAYAQKPSIWPPSVPSVKGKSSTDEAKNRMQLFGLAAAVFVLLSYKGSPRWTKWLGLLPAGAGLYLAMQLAELYPLDEKEQTLLRAVVAGIAAVAVIRQSFWGKKNEADQRITTGVLAVCAVLAVGCYYHFGMPQFRDDAKGRPTLVHPWDMRVYFPVAKYFGELRFDGLYLASVAAYLDNTPGSTPASVANVELRDLTNNEMKKAGAVMDQIQGVRTRFTPERWEQFRTDMKYFQDLMGRGAYLGSLRDHGGNATPVWLLGAWLLFARVPASELTMTLSGLIDPVMLGVMFYAIWRTFGARASLVTMIVWGTTDLSRFGTNLMGSTLRMDWMIALGLGACALKTRRWWLGGALFAYGGLIRGFPGLAAVFLAAPALWWLIDWVRTHKTLPSVVRLRTEQRSFLLAAVGVTACVIALVGVSSAVFGFDTSWGNWYRKISIHQEKPNVNHVGIRTLLSYESDKTSMEVLHRELPEPWTEWQQTQLAAWHRRKPLFYGIVALSAALAFVACRKKRLDQAGLLGMFLVPVVMYPANYYCHYVFLLPLIAASKDDETNPVFSWMALVSFGMSVALYPTLQQGAVDILFTQQSAILIGGLLLMLAPLAWFAWREGERTAPVPALADGTLAEEPREPPPEPEKAKRRKKKAAQVEGAVADSETSKTGEDQ